MKSFKLIRGVIVMLITAIALSFAAVPELAFSQQGPKQKTSLNKRNHFNNRNKHRIKTKKKNKKKYKHNHRKHFRQKRGQ